MNMRQKTTPSERMQEVLKTLGITANDFERRCGLGNGFTLRVTSVITRQTRAKIKSAFPNLNIDYIARNEGGIFAEEAQAKGSIKERIGQFVKYMDIPEKEFCRRSNIALSFVSRMSDNIRKSSLDKIYNAFPNLNPEWLEYGRGEMIIEPQEKQTTTPNERIRELIRFLALSIPTFEAETGLGIGIISNNYSNITKKTIERIVTRFPFVNPLYLMHGQGEMILKAQKPLSKTELGKFSFAPLVTQRAYAGFLGGFADEDYMLGLEKIPYIQSEDTKGNIIAIEVSGDSMDDGSYDSYRNGDIVICKELILSEYKDNKLPINHYDFVIVHSEGVLIKRITEHDVETGNITLHSLNQFYGDVVTNISNIKGIFSVIQKISTQKR